MARGWESKSIENQIEDAEASRYRMAEPEVPIKDRERHRRTMTLTLAQGKIRHDLAVVTDVRPRALLERSLAYIDAELETLK